MPNSKNISFETLQNNVISWAYEKFPEQTLQGKINHLWKELIEIWEEAHSDRCREEIVDCALLLCQFGVKLPDPPEDFTLKMLEKFEINQRRIWKSMGDDGAIHHQKD